MCDSNGTQEARAAGALLRGLAKAEGTAIQRLEARVEVIRRLLDAHWSAAARRALADLLTHLGELRQAPDGTLDLLDVSPRARDAFLQDFVVAVLASLFRQTARPFAQVEAAAIRETVRFIAGLGVDALSGPPKLLASDVPGLVTRAVRDLEFWNGRRLQEREQELRDLLTQYLTTHTIRNDSKALKEWKDQLTNVVVDPSESTSHMIADLWAFRTYAVATAGAASRLGFVELRARATIDLRTTDFCRAIDGTMIEMRVIRQQISNYYDAVNRGDAAAAKAAWPILLGNQSAETVFVNKVGPPPYHPWCRTILIAVLS